MLSSLIPNKSPLNNEQLQDAVQQIQKLKTQAIFISLEKSFPETVRKFTSEQLDQINRQYFLVNKTTILSMLQEKIKEQSTLDLLMRTLGPRHDSWAIYINRALEGAQYDLLYAFIILLDEQDAKKVKICFKNRFNQSLESRIQSLKPSFAQKLLLKWLQREQAPSPLASPKDTARSIQSASKNDPTGVATKDALITLFTQTNQQDFLNVLTEYKNLTKEDLFDKMKYDLTQNDDLLCAQFAYYRLQGVQRYVAFALSIGPNKYQYLCILVRDRVEWAAEVPEVRRGVSEGVAVLLGLK